MNNQIKKIAVLTSGGDAPGMNACIRAIVRTSLANDIDVIGFMHGYSGVINSDYIKFDSQNVSEIMQRGGTILCSARCKEMFTKEGRQKAAKVCKQMDIDALIVIGGDGSLNGAIFLADLGLKIIGIPCTIDLDIACSDYTIGFDTAVNTAMEAIDKIRDTSFSHERCTVVEVMGRNAGYIALWCSITNGAEEVLLPEKKEVTPQDVINLVANNKKNGKLRNIIVIAEGYQNISSHDLAKNIESATGVETRAAVLGYLQRGGAPTALDRMHASIMGYNAVDELLKGNFNQIIVYKNGKYTSIGLKEGLSITKDYDDTVYKIAKIFAL